jgi:methylenetetrahydrofolate dehydrogenase (NADP+)/methenyltetrahydrofolate cyclohydrolase
VAQILKGAPAAAALNEKTAVRVAALREKGVTPTLAILRVGERPDDISYENSALKRCEKLGIRAKRIILPADTAQDTLIETIRGLNTDPEADGVLMFRPLPKGIDESFVGNCLHPAKDIDGITNTSIAGVYSGRQIGFPPCTPQAVMEILSYYGIDLNGKRTVVIGRSLVIGKPIAMMLLAQNATVTICHTHTEDMPAICRNAEILVAAVGRAKMIDKNYLSPGQIVVDVGINVDESGQLCGDVDFEQAEPIVRAITPVPGGIGSVTTAVLAQHVLDAATIPLS